MKILKHGVTYQQNLPFMCSACGCLYKTSGEDLKYESAAGMNLKISSVCPECSTTNIRYYKKEEKTDGDGN